MTLLFSSFLRRREGDDRIRKVGSFSFPFLLLWGNPSVRFASARYSSPDLEA
ncbi:hypothetical protein MUK42_17527 [Musa troglodytarum]|nr:hypothetical protein MUK42_17527 [Musa troglodytarum]